ncbi:MAG TPA: ABC transporter permease [Steroidobacteraceae bacterium]
MVSRLHQSLLRDLWHLRGQVLAAGLVVACGIAAFVTMLSAYTSLRTARTAYYSEYRFADVFAHLKRAPEGLAADLRAIPGVAAVDTRVVEDVTVSVPGLAEPATGRLISLPSRGPPSLNNLSLRAGRSVGSDAADEILVSETFAHANRLAVGDRIGAILNGRWKQLTIVGLALSPEYIYEVSPAMVFPDNRRFGVMWMSREMLADAFDMKGAFNDVALRTAHGASEADVIDAVDRLLAPYGGLSAYGRADQASNRFLTDELGEIEVSATYIPAIFLSVSAFLLYTLMSRLVSIQRSQIALLKAFGYSNSRVGMHFLELALLIVGIGLVVGTGMGLTLGRGMIGLYRLYFHFPVLPFRAPLSVLLWAIVIAVAAASSGSLTSVWRAIRLPPAEALRPEPPANFRAGALESVALLRRLGTSGRVIVRNLSRRPWRAAMSITGIAAAVATVVLGRFTFDAVDHLMAVHFDSSQRDDVTVVLREAATGAVVYEIARLPGVLRAEPFRSTPVWLRFQHHAKRATLQSISPDMDLKQLVDRDRRPIDVPPDGLVLTRKLAQMLGVSLGDVVKIEQLEGRRVVFERPIVKLSEEPLGVSAYMDSKALSRALRESDEVSAVLLEVDRSKEQMLFETLKRMPTVGAVAIRSAMLQTIREVTNRSFVMMTIVMTSFAAVLVVGVVYNSARIALSERGNELASLRVLGFSKAEVTALLLGEQVILTLSAIPLGLGLGAAACRLLIPVFDRELFRLPFVLSTSTFGFAAVITLIAAAISAALVVGRIARLDLIAVLKSRE